MSKWAAPSKTVKNAWGITEAEYKTARKRSADITLPEEETSAYFQLCRFYQGQIFYRDEAEKAVHLIRGRK